MALITKNRYRDEFWGEKFWVYEVDVELEDSDIDEIKEAIKEALIYGFNIPIEWEVDKTNYIYINIWDYLDLSLIDEIKDEVIEQLKKENENDWIKEVEETVENFKKEYK